MDGGGWLVAMADLADFLMGTCVYVCMQVASAVAGKLSGPELKGILAMTDRLKRLEALVGQFQAENEDARQRLSGAEAMKDLLLQRLREAELALGRERDGARYVRGRC